MARPRTLSAAAGAGLALVLVAIPGGSASATSLVSSPPTDAGQLTNAVHHEVTQVFDPATGELVRTTTFDDAYNFQGRLLRSSTVDSDAAGVQTSSRVTTNTYVSGRLVSETLVIDQDGAGPQPASTSHVQTLYDTRGLVTQKITTFDVNSDGIAEVTQTSNFSTSVKSRTITVRGDADTDKDGTTDLVSTHEAVYDAQGNLLSSLDTFDDLTTAANPDSAVTYNATYGSQNRVLSTHSDQSFGGVLRLSITGAYTYDSKGNLAKIVTLDDAPGTDGDSSSTDTYAYDSKGRLVLMSNVQRNSFATATNTVRLSYDSKGRLISRVTESDTDTDGIVDGYIRDTLVYDAKGRLATYDTKYYGPGSTFMGSSSSQYAYTKNQIVITTEYDDDGDGTVDSVIVVTRAG